MSRHLLRERVRTPVDVALARARIGRLLASVVPGTEEGAEFLAGATARALAHVESGLSGEVVLELSGDRRTLRATVVAEGRECGPWVCTLGLSEPMEDPERFPEVPEVELLASQLLAGDALQREVAVLARQRAHELDSHQRELEETNQGVLALHAELAQASDEQRRLLAAERAARDEAERSRNRLTFLSSASAQLMASLQLPEIYGRLEKLLIPAYAVAVDLWLLDEEELTPLGAAPGETVGPPESATRALAERRPVGGPARGGACQTAFPLLLGVRPLGVMVLTRNSDLEDDDLMVGELARRVAAALDNAMRFEHERSTAATLQRGMLTEIPAVPGLGLTARYLPAARGMNVGGDWYDVFPLDDGEYIGVVGDVTGHGIHAAMTMGQLRTALRAYSMAERSPAVLLERLHRLLDRLEPDLFATAVIARFRPGSPEVTMAGAGHPAPLCRTTDGKVEPVALPSGAMLGLPVELAYTDHSVELSPGGALLMYTDGLVERRGEGIDEGIDRLARSFGALDGFDRDPEGAVDELLRSALSGHDCDDDVCMLVVRPLREQD